MEALTVAEQFVTPIVETVTKGLINIVKDETLSIFNVKKELEGIERKMRQIMVIIKEAEKKSLDNEGVRLWMSDLKGITYDIDDIIDDCKVKAQAIASRGSRIGDGTHFATFSRLKNLKFSHKIGKRVKEINVKLEEFASKKDQLRAITPNRKDQNQLNNAERIISTTTHFAVDNVVGCVKEDVEKLMKQILDENGSGEKIGVNLAILGMGGIGKTTLAQRIFDIVTHSGKFQQNMWICVSKNFKAGDLVKEIVRQVDEKYRKGETLTEHYNALKKAVRDRRFFLVLDDVWNADVWDMVLKDTLNSGASGSKILITTRDVNIAKRMFASHLYELKLLGIQEGWLLLCNNVFKTEKERNANGHLKDVGIKIVEKCGGLPLAIKAIAKILQTKEKRISEWEKIISSEVWTQNIFEINDVMKILYLSYEDLSYQLKQCFIYCSYFPENYTFNKRNLSQLWIAEGFLGDKATLESGEDLVNELISRNLLQQDNFTNYYKFHGLLRSLGQFLGNGEHFYGNLKNLDKSVRHLSIQDENSLVNDLLQRHNQRLRTLILFGGSELTEVPKSVFQKLHYLRVLSLSGTSIDAIPNSIKYLLHLRYLDLSNSKIRIISKSIGYLKNLQFLLLVGCEFLKELPESITSLQNLMSLVCEVQMPKGIGSLKQLQCLKFRVPENENEAKLGCTLHELQSSNSFEDLCILNLQKYLSLDEVRSLKLMKKNRLRNLTLHWKPTEDVSDKDINNIAKVIEEFRPPSSLLNLFIFNFYGHNLPNWMSCSNEITLNNLMQLEIKGCAHCQQLHGFGKLPHLQILKIYEASSIQRIGPGFLGRGDRSTDIYFRPFPKLENLTLEDFSELEEWHWNEAEDDKDGGTNPFPCLQYLFIVKCPKLKSLPDGLQHATSLVELVLDGNRDLERIPRLPTVKNLSITNCSSMLHVGV